MFLPFKRQLTNDLQAIGEMQGRGLPVVLEEEFDHTVRLIWEMADGTTVIIPHLGMLNGGFRSNAEADLWAQENVWADTALAGFVHQESDIFHMIVQIAGNDVESHSAKLLLRPHPWADRVDDDLQCLFVGIGPGHVEVAVRQRTQ